MQGRKGERLAAWSSDVGWATVHIQVEERSWGDVAAALLSGSCPLLLSLSLDCTCSGEAQRRGGGAPWWLVGSRASVRACMRLYAWCSVLCACQRHVL